jgi:hypothetical protein
MADSESDISAEIHQIANDVRRGGCTPIIGNKLVLDMLLKGRGPLAKKWADFMAQDPKVQKKCPWDNPVDLAQVAQFYNIEPGWPVDPKTKYLEFLRSEYEQVHKLDFDEERTQIPVEVLRQAGSVTFTQLVAEYAHHPAFEDLLVQPVQGAPDVTQSGRDASNQGEQAGDSWRNTPLTVLATFPIDIFVTTSPHFFLERSLLRERKHPASDLYQWKEGSREPLVLQEDEAKKYAPVRAGSKRQEDVEQVEWRQFVPSKNTPLVCHLFGIESNDASLLLSEEDHLDFMLGAVNAFRKGPIDRTQAVPSCTLNSRVIDALSSRFLLLLGFDMDGWDLRALLKGLINRLGREKGKTGVAVQADPTGSSEGYRRYLEKSYESLNLHVLWRSPDRFIMDLRDQSNRM